MTDPLHRPIIFFGVPRSGTSIISDAFMRHPDVAFPSQYASKLPGLVRLNHLRSLLDNRYWRATGSKAQINRTRWYNRYVFRPGECYELWTMLADERFRDHFLADEPASAADVARIRDYFARLVRYQRRHRLALKLTGPPRLAYLASVFPDALFVEIRRRHLPTVRSLLRVDFWARRAEPVKWSGAYTDAELDLMRGPDSDEALVTALQVRRIEDVADAERAALDIDYLRLRYEDFTSAPAATMERLAERAGLVASEAILRFDGEFAIHHRDVDAEAYFSAEQRALLERVFGAEGPSDVPEDVPRREADPP